MLTLTRPTRIAAGIGGALWTLKALVITANDGSFDPLESVVFIGGVLALTTAAVILGFHLTRGAGRLARVPAAAGVAIGLVVATLLLESLGKYVVGGIAPGDNLGLEAEGGILCCGLVWLAIARLSASGRRAAPPRVVAA
jgi:hypothetical protein